MISILKNFDERATEYVSAKLSPVLSFLKFIKFTANQTSYWLVLLFLWGPAKFDLGSLIVITTGIVILTGLLMVLKLKIRRNRPISKDRTVHVFDAYSFPSGHATRVGFIVSTASVIGISSMPLYGMIIWSILVCLERITSKEHFLFDVIAGLVIGITLGVFWPHFIDIFV